MNASPRQASRKRLLIVLVAKTTLNSAHRIVYPFLPSIASGVGISLTAASGLIALRGVPGVVAPFLGLVADRHGRRRTMEVALLLFTLVHHGVNPSVVSCC